MKFYGRPAHSLGIYAISMVALALLVSCSLLQGDPGTRWKVPIELVFSDPFYPVSEPERYEIRSKDQLDQLFAELGQTRKPAPEPPRVNFKKDMLLVICRGSYSYMHAPILTLREADSVIHVEEQYAVPRELRKQRVSGAAYFPLWIYKIPHRPGTVVFDYSSKDTE